MSHSSSNSSLLHVNRPESLPPLPSELANLAKGTKKSQSSADLSKNNVSLASSSPLSHSTPNFPTTSQMPAQTQPIASTSAGMSYLNVEPTSSPSGEHAVACNTSPVSTGDDCVRSCASLLATAPASAIGEAMNKNRWQPDDSSALCTFPLCTANFAQTNYFFLGPRRHHCRLCGQLFCAAHTVQRAPMMHTDAQGRRYVAQERVCDLCLPHSHDEDVQQPGLSGFTRRSSTCSESDPSSDPADSYLITPHSEDGSAHSIFRTGSRVTLDLASPDASGLAPIEEWMDRSGVLSLYPLAVNASHSRTRRSHSPTPAAGPLFAPSIRARRDAKEKEMERLTLRERRFGQEDSNFWLPAKWGYKREDFDPSFSLDGEDQTHRQLGGVVEDGPIRFRTSVRKVTSPLAAPVSSKI